MIANALRVLALSAVLFSSNSAWAEWPPLDDLPKVAASGGEDVAVIVAIEDYLLLPDVPGAVANANEWELFLRNGMKVRDVHVLANQNATREAMLKFAKTAAADVGEGGTVWWIFIGHGAPAVDGQDAMLVGMDAQKTVESLEARGLPKGLLLNTLQSSRHNTVLVLDAGFNGRTADGSPLAPGVQPVIAVADGGTLLKKTVVMSASKPTENAGPLAQDVARPGFSYLLLGALRGWADANDGQVTAAEAVYYTQRQMRKIKGRQQTPQIAGNVALVLSRGVDEKKPRVVSEGLESEKSPAKEPPRRVASADDSKAALTLEYLQRRVVFEGKIVRQAGRILDGPAFYTAIGRPDLAAKWKSHKPVMWTTGIATVVASSIFMGVALGQPDDQGQDNTGWVVSGGLVGGLGIIGGTLMIVFGFVGDHHPMNFSERRAAVEQLNAKLREERGLGPEVDWQNEAVDKRRSPWGAVEPSGGSNVVGFRVRF